MTVSSNPPHRSPREFSLSIVVSLLILGMGGIMLAMFSWQEITASLRRMEQGEVRQAQLLGLTISATIEASLRRGDPASARRAFDRANTARNLDVACYLGPDDRVVYSTRKAFVGEPLEATPLTNLLSEVREARGSVRGQVGVRKDRSRVTGIFPVFLDAHDRGVLGSSVGVFVLQHDISLMRADVIRESVCRSLWAGLVLAVFCTLIWAALRRLLLVRIARLREFADLVPKRDDVPHIPVTGIDELAALARRLELMATELSENARQLREAQKMEAIGRLAGGVAHDFNNMLTVILGNIELGRAAIEDSPESAAAILPVLDEIEQAGTRAASLTQQLLAFGRQNLARPRVLSAAEGIQRLAPLMRRMLGEDHELKIEVETDRLVEIDPGHFEQIVLNLVINARDAMHGGGTISLRCAATMMEADATTVDAVSISVRDTGHGIDDKDLPHIFEPYFSTKQLGQGSGLGLSTVYSVVAETGGRIDVESTPGVGSSFRVVFPAAATSSDTSAISGFDPDTEPEMPAQSENRRGRLLFCEDDDPVRRVTASILRSYGYDVTEASRGEEALAILMAPGAETIDVVVSDVMMPGMSGVELARRVSDDRPGIRVVLLSGYASQLRERDLSEIPNCRFIAKPYQVAALLDAVAEQTAATR